MSRQKRKRSIAGDVLAGYLKSVGWTQQQLADACGINKALVSLYLSGKRRVSVQNALLLQQGTRAALAAKLVDAPAIEAAALVPTLAAVIAAPPSGAETAA